jgi:hypothetical protein
LTLHAGLGVVADSDEAKSPVTFGDLLELYEDQAN